MCIVFCYVVWRSFTACGISQRWQRSEKVSLLDSDYWNQQINPQANQSEFQQLQKGLFCVHIGSNINSSVYFTCSLDACVRTSGGQRVALPLKGTSPLSHSHNGFAPACWPQLEPFHLNTDLQLSLCLVMEIQVRYGEAHFQKKLINVLSFLNFIMKTGN